MTDAIEDIIRRIRWRQYNNGNPITYNQMQQLLQAVDMNTFAENKERILLNLIRRRTCRQIFSYVVQKNCITEYTNVINLLLSMRTHERYACGCDLGNVHCRFIMRLRIMMKTRSQWYEYFHNISALLATYDINLVNHEYLFDWPCLDHRDKIMLRAQTQTFKPRLHSPSTVILKYQFNALIRYYTAHADIYARLEPSINAQTENTQCRGNILLVVLQDITGHWMMRTIEPQCLSTIIHTALSTIDDTNVIISVLSTIAEIYMSINGPHHRRVALMRILSQYSIGYTESTKKYAIKACEKCPIEYVGDTHYCTMAKKKF